MVRCHKTVLRHPPLSRVAHYLIVELQLLVGVHLITVVLPEVPFVGGLGTLIGGLGAFIGGLGLLGEAAITKD
jgi:hypothetical protein